MSAQRYISTSFWTDPWVLDELTSDERYVYLYMLTAPNSNIAGVFELSMREAELHTGYDRDQLKRIFKRFEESGKAYYFERYIIVPMWPRHQRYEKRESIRQGIVNQLKDLPEAVWNKIHEVGYVFPLEQVDRGYTPPSTPHEPRYLDRDTDTDIEKDGDAPARIDIGTHFSVTQKQWQSLLSDYMEYNLRDYAERINDWIDGKGKKPYTDYAAAVRNWLKKDNVTKRLKESPTTWDLAEED